MLVTAMLDHINHAAAMSQMLSLGIKENKQAEVALAAVASLSSYCLALFSAEALPSLAGPAVGKSVMGAKGSGFKLISVDPDGSIARTGMLESSLLLSESHNT